MLRTGEVFDNAVFRRALSDSVTSAAISSVRFTVTDQHSAITD